MSTINQMIYDVRERLNQLSDDSEFSDKLILHRINQVRSTFLLQHLNNFRIPTSLDIIQTLCMETELVSNTICGIEGCEQILRTKEKLPQTLIKHTGPSIISVSTPKIFSEPISIISQDKAGFTKYKKIKGIFAFLGSDNHIYIYSDISESYKFIECIMISAVFYNPLELVKFKNCCECSDEETTCYDYDTTTYPIIADLEEAVVTRVIETFKPKLEIPEDKINNSDDK